MKKIQTVLGEISPEDLGITMPHIHIFNAHPRDPKDPTECLPDIEKNILELEYYRSAGGNSVVDGSPAQNVRILKKISEQSKVNIISTTGPSWRDETLLQKNINDVTNIFIKNIEKGVGDTDIKCGVLKSGASYNHITPLQERTFTVLAKAHLKTNAPIFIHTTIGTMGVEILEILKNEGVKLNRVMVGHIDRNPDLNYYKELAKMGAYLLFDQISKVKYWPVSLHINILKKLLEAGFQKQILFSLDFGHWTDLKAYGRGPGYTYILEKYLPRLRKEGIKEEIIEDIMINNPKTVLSI